MWWKKEIDDHNALIILRIAISFMYVCVSFYLSFASETNFIILQGFKNISNFCLMLAFVILFPVVESIYTAAGKHFVNMLSVVFACFLIVIMHVYLFNSFGVTQTYGFVFGSFWLNIVLQLPVVYLIKKVYAKR